MRYKKTNYFLSEKNIFYIFIFLGFLFGMVLSFVYKGKNGIEDEVWLDNLLLSLQYGDIYYNSMFFYVLKKRFHVLFIILILYISKIGKYTLLVGPVCIGGIFGFFITQFIQCKGILGCILFVTMMFPHAFFYCYSYYIIFNKIFYLLFKKNIIDCNGQSEKQKYIKNTLNLTEYILPVIVVIIGMLLECYVNPFLMKIFLKIFL